MARGPKRTTTTASVLTTLALLVGTMVAVAPSAVAATPKTAHDVPVLKSDPAPKVVPQRLSGDFSNAPPNPSQADATTAPAKPSAYDPARSVPVDAETTPTKKVVMNSDGSLTQITSAAPVRFQDATGWHDIDLTLVPGADGSLAARSAQGTATLAAKADGTTAAATVASIDTPAGPIALRHPQSSPAPAVVNKATATYKGALGGRDLILALSATGFEETVVAPTAKAASTYTDELVLPAGVTARDGDGGVELVDAKGNVLATISNGVALDSAPGAKRAAAPVTVHVVPNAATAPPSTPPSTTLPASTSTTAPGASSTSTTPSTTIAPTTTTTAPAAPAPAKPADNVATVAVGVDQGWFSDPARVFPISLDPTVTVATNASNAYGIDTFAYAAAPTTNYGTASALYAGNISGASQSFIKFNNLVVTPGPDVWVTESHLMLLGGAANDCSKPVDVQAIDGTLSAATVWANKPATDGAVVSTTTLGAGCGSIWDSFDTTTLARRWLGLEGAPNYGLRVSATDPADPAAFKWFWSGNTANPPLLYVTYEHLPTLSTPVAPATATVVTTATPTLATAPATDPEGDLIHYWFRATPAPDAESGAKMVDSGWLDPTLAANQCGANICYTAPVGALTDGVTYYWHAWTEDPYHWRVPTGTVFSFRVDLGLGDKGAQPRDGVGPVAVNLASGNAVVHAASPSFTTPGGGIGLAYTYNSQAPANLGLTGSYYPDSGTHLFPSGSTAPAMTRTDPTIDHYWGTDGPGLGLSPTNFLVRWTGSVTVPTTGSYTFAADHDDGMRMWVNGTQILNHWSDGSFQNPSEVASPISLTGGATVPIVVEYYQSGGAALATISVVPPGATLPTQLPPTWLTPDTAVSTPVLSAGWTLAQAQLSYTSAVLGDRWVGFVDTSGAMHTWTWTTLGGYTPPLGDDGVVGLDASGALSLHATDGIDYVFDGAGRLKSATSPLDDGGVGSVSSMGYTWTGTKPRLTTITDTATGRFITLAYGAGGPCAAGTPADALCQVTYWDATTTKLTYAAGQLARIEDPGGTIAPVTDFNYSGGRLTSVRSPLAADAVAPAATVATGRTNDATVLTEVAYDTSVTPARASSVTLPAPTAGTGVARPAHSYAYTSPTLTTVTVAATPANLVHTVTFSRGGANVLTVGGTDADGVALPTTVYDSGDRLLSATDAAGRLSTVTYDDDVAARAWPSGRATNTYGPAPISCFTGYRPNATCNSPTTTPAHTATTFDTNATTAVALNGLAATYWPNQALAAQPANHGPVAATAGSLVTADPPAANLGADNWSARYTGEVTLDPTGTYGLALTLIGRARLYVDDRLVVDAWAGYATATYLNSSFTNTVAGRHRIRVDYATQAATSPALVLHWTRPGGSDTGLPGASLAPRYSTPTASVTDDTTLGVASRANDVLYPSMANRLVGDATADRTGANLVTTTGYEILGSGYLRPTTRIVGTGAAATTTATYTYYGAEAALSTCAGTSGVSQAKALKNATGVTPGSGPALVHQFAYDAAGRMAGSATAGDWTCTAHDARGRVSTASVPAYGTQLAHSITTDFAVGTNPMVSSVSDTIASVPPVTTTITTTVDLLGRVVSYTDVWGKITTTTYDQAGRATDTSGPAGAMHVGYSPAGRASTQTLDGAPTALATATYNTTTGELVSASYANAGNGTSLASISRSPAGMTNALSWALPGGGALATDLVTRSQSGRVTDETIDGTDADPANPNFTYDPLGRLKQARVLKAAVLDVQDYSFAPLTAPTGCSAQAVADPGRNADRTSLADTLGTAATVTTKYCYDNADRLLSSTDAAVGTPVYDSHGNTTTLGTQALVYDGADRHMATTDGATTVTYLRDVTGRITSRTEGSAITHYGYAGPGDSPAFVMDVNNTVPPLERTIGLLGGVTVTKRAAGDVWSYRNVHGDVMATADSAGAKQGATKTYDAFGTILTPPLPDNSAGNFDYGWLGSAQRPTEHAGNLATIEMGARPYVPSLGRFLQADPVAGGSCNDYDYVCGDSVNGRDLGGMSGKQPPLPAEFEAECNPLINSNYEELTSGLCVAYRYAQQTGNNLQDFYYQGYNSLQNPVDVTQHSSFNQVAAKYFESCVQGASTSAVTGALTGPEGALEGAAIGCGIGVGKTVASSRAGNAIGNDLSAGSSGANLGEAGYYISQYGFSQYVTMLSTAGVP